MNLGLGGARILFRNDQVLYLFQCFFKNIGCNDGYVSNNFFSKFLLNINSEIQIFYNNFELAIQKFFNKFAAWGIRWQQTWIKIVELFRGYWKDIDSDKKIQSLKIFFLCITILFFIFSIYYWYFYDATLGFQKYLLYNHFFQVGIDGTSLVFILLTTSIFPLIFLISWNITLYMRELLYFLLGSEILLLLVFLIFDLFGFYIFFELLLFPMIYLIGFWGSRSRRIKAGYYFFLYTTAGSLLMLFGLILIVFEKGSTNYSILAYDILNPEKQKILWLLFFVPFAIKIPMYPFHIWLPEAHVEASTLGSIILAALLLKVGSYGFLRILIFFLPVGTYYFTPLVYVISLISILFSSVILLRQIDIKKIIAYSSIAHMNFSLLGLFSQIIEGVEGGLFLMFSHGYSSGALFFCIGLLYERYHTRLLHYFSGFSLIMPMFTCCFLIMTLANFGFPGTANFIGEFIILLGLIQLNNQGYIFGLIIGLIFSLIYSILLYNRICFGELKLEAFFPLYYSDLTKRELIISGLFIYYLISLGLESWSILDLMHVTLFHLIF